MQKLKILREKRKLSQKELATQLSVDRTTVTKWETTDAYPHALFLPKVAKVLQCKIDNLF
ncbi:helix-turn-helix transcriptional regulator [Pectinatus frisingensis]|uniref:helix-turn-helix transcriptional regulator n=1 Tax=Pectinatus frisingensis TaxID=865 RepID=UPI0018C6F7EF|nr:helix-turn-helix transcriptional regulator [Pectinatus frisingensis]